jgi:uncharacterized membrane protein YoaK (UPF0700 family)
MRSIRIHLAAAALLAASLALSATAHEVAGPPPTAVAVVGASAATVILAQQAAKEKAGRVPAPSAPVITNTFGFPQDHAALLAFLDKADLTAEQWRVLPQMVSIYEGTKAQLVPIGGWTSAAEATLVAMKTALAKGKAAGKVT